MTVSYTVIFGKIKKPNVKYLTFSTTYKFYSIFSDIVCQLELKFI